VGTTRFPNGRREDEMPGDVVNTDYNVSSGTARFAGQIGQAEATWPRKSDFFQKFLNMRGEESPDPYAASFTGGSREASHCLGKSSSSWIDFQPLASLSKTSRRYAFGSKPKSLHEPGTV
jgi:hypothetical protein